MQNPTNIRHIALFMVKTTDFLGRMQYTPTQKDATSTPVASPSFTRMQTLDFGSLP